MARPFNSRVYRRQNQVYGVLVRWWKRLPCECEGQGECDLCEGNSGQRWIEQEIPLSKYDGKPCRVLPNETALAMKDIEPGQIPDGSLSVSVMFDEFPLARLDRLMLLDPQLREMVSEIITRSGAGDLDRLGRGNAIDVAVLTANRVIYALGRDFEIAPSGDAIQWLSGPGAARPEAGTRLSIQYAVLIPFTLLDVQNEARQGSSDGASLPLEFVLTR